MCLSEFDQQLAMLEVVWNERENPFSGASDPRFYHYFKQYKADAVCYNMLTGVREAAGMGSPPSIFTTNMNESLNYVIKQHVHVQYKASEWPEFNSNLKQLIDAKREKIIQALSGRGQYWLQPQYSHLGVELKWQRMRPDQRKELIHRFDEAALCSSRSVHNPKSTVESSSQHCASQDVSSSQSTQSFHCNLDTASTSASSSNHPPPSMDSVLDTATTSSKLRILDTASTPSNHPPPRRLSILDTASTSSNHPLPSVLDTASTSSNYPPLSSLSIGANESGLNLHKEVLSGIWEKAEKPFKLEQGLQPAASSDRSAWSVQSFSSPIPLFVTSKENGQFMCDPPCP